MTILEHIMFEKRSIVVTKTNLKSSRSDAAYWRSQPYAVRLAALETIRREFHQWKYHAEPGFQRVYKIVKRA
jgi:hypothetical protein